MLVYIKENQLGRANFVNAEIGKDWISVTIKNPENGEVIEFSHELELEKKFNKKALMIIFERVKNVENDHRNILDEEYVEETAKLIQKKADNEWF